MTKGHCEVKSNHGNWILARGSDQSRQVIDDEILPGARNLLERIRAAATDQIGIIVQPLNKLGYQLRALKHKLCDAVRQPVRPQIAPLKPFEDFRHLSLGAGLTTAAK